MSRGQVDQIHETLQTDLPSRLEGDDHSRAQNTGSSDLMIPLVREELELQKELVDKATVRITKVVKEKAAFVDELLASEHIEVERFPVDQIVAAPPSVQMEGDVMIIPVVEEVLVVTKQFRVKEELRVTTKRLHTRHHEEVKLRIEDVIVERFSNGKTD